MEYQFIDWQSKDGAARLTLNRPPLNIINIAMLNELGSALEVIARDESLKVMVVQAEGKMFSAGVDVADHTADKVGEMIPLFNRVCDVLSNFPTPTLAVVQGHALGGGCEIAVCCDLIIAAEAANFAQPEIKLATIAPIAAMRLPGLIGYRRAAELLFTGDPIGAAEAAKVGLINRAVPIEQLDQAVDQLIDKLTKLSGSALRLCKRALRVNTLAAMEKLYLNELMSTADTVEGLTAFMEKRAPLWKNR
ncbi:MAG TPA: enoyl-CoA hydratase-related protein [Anaerolineae bacterium]|nr:enoyl-CoA hydratase-related protein [Anaerolineae bacterium]